MPPGHTGSRAPSRGGSRAPSAGGGPRSGSVRPGSTRAPSHHGSIRGPSRHGSMGGHGPGYGSPTRRSHGPRGDFNRRGGPPPSMLNQGHGHRSRSSNVTRW